MCQYKRNNEFHNDGLIKDVNQHTELNLIMFRFFSAAYLVNLNCVQIMNSVLKYDNIRTK